MSVTITSAAEQSFVASLLDSGTHWIGLPRFGAPEYGWITGEELSYENWRSGEPDVSEDAGAVIDGDTLRWSDEEVSAEHRALCERP